MYELVEVFIQVGDSAVNLIASATSEQNRTSVPKFTHCRLMSLSRSLDNQSSPTDWWERNKDDRERWVRATFFFPSAPPLSVSFVSLSRH